METCVLTRGKPNKRQGSEERDSEGKPDIKRETEKDKESEPYTLPVCVLRPVGLVSRGVSVCVCMLENMCVYICTV